MNSSWFIKGKLLLIRELADAFSIKDASDVLISLFLLMIIKLSDSVSNSSFIVKLDIEASSSQVLLVLEVSLLNDSYLFSIMENMLLYNSILEFWSKEI